MPQQPRPYHDDASTLGTKSLGAGDVDDHTITQGQSLPRIFIAGDELQSLCRAEISGGDSHAIVGFPPTCLPIVRLLAGNHCCVDCGDEEQDRLIYASIGYGTILCAECAHRHVTMSEKVSDIRLFFCTILTNYLPPFIYHII